MTQGDYDTGRGPGYTRSAGFGSQQGPNPRTRLPATPPQFQRETPPQDPRSSPQYTPRPAPQPGFTPGYRPQPQQPRGKYPPPQPAWQQPQQQQAWQQPYPPQYAPQPFRQRRSHVARNVLGGLGGLVVLIIAISFAANSGHSVRTTGSAGSTGGTGAQNGSVKKTAGVGTAIALTGNGSGEQMAVTVTKVIGDAEPGDEITSAPSGDRLYAVQFRLADTGSAAYSDAPSNGAEVTDSTGQSYDASLMDSAAGCASFPGTENVAPGSSGLGCIVFEVPASAKITQVQFTLDSGMGPDTGQWHVG
jgi:hypothetical protein